MRKGTLLEYFELESVEFQDQYIVGGQPRSTHISWFRYYDEILFSCRHRFRRVLFLAILLVSLVVLVTISTLKNDEETPVTAYNALHLFEEGSSSLFGECNHYCCAEGHPEPANKPYERRVSRSFCENDFGGAELEVLEDTRNSEMILGCYNLTYRYCIPYIYMDIPNYDADKNHHWSFDCAYQFFDHDGLLYSASGNLMPESFNANCQETLLWRYMYYLSPETDCGDDVPLRFCNCNGTIDVDFLAGDGPFNCREFDFADQYKMGRDEDGLLEWHCNQECQKGCP